MNKNKKNEVANKKKKQTIVAEKQRKPGKFRASICRKVELFNLPSLVCFEQLIE